MKMKAKPHLDSDINKRLWLGMLGGPVIWLVQFQARYSLVEWVCHSQKSFVLLLVSGVSLLLVGFCALDTVACLRQSKAPPQSDEDEAIGRVRFMAELGLCTSALFALLIAAQAIPNFFISPCAR
jgi:hypothetical protein